MAGKDVQPCQINRRLPMHGHRMREDLFSAVAKVSITLAF
jgi:hypothetical protein